MVLLPPGIRQNMQLLKLIQSDVRSVGDGVRKLEQRVHDLELIKEHSDRDPFFGSANEFDPRTRGRGNDFPLGSTIAANEVSTEDIQSAYKYKAVKESYSKQEIPKEFKLFPERSGVKREDQPKYNIIANCSKYSETILKILASNEDNMLSKDKIEQVLTVPQHNRNICRTSSPAS